MNNEIPESPEPQRAFKGVWIPAEVWDSNLSPAQKLLWATVSSLGTIERPCCAGNEWLAKRMGTSPGATAVMLSELRAKGWIKDVKFDGRRRLMLAVIANPAFSRGLNQPLAGTKACPKQALKSESASNRKSKEESKEKNLCAEAQPSEGVSVSSQAATGELPFSPADTFPATVIPSAPAASGACSGADATTVPPKAQKPATAKPQAAKATPAHDFIAAWCDAYKAAKGKVYARGYITGADAGEAKRFFKANPTANIEELIALAKSTWGKSDWKFRTYSESIMAFLRHIPELDAPTPPAPKPWQKAGPIAPVGQFTETKAHDPVEFFKP